MKCKTPGCLNDVSSCYGFCRRCHDLRDYHPRVCKMSELKEGNVFVFHYKKSHTDIFFIADSLATNLTDYNNFEFSGYDEVLLIGNLSDLKLEGL